MDVDFDKRLNETFLFRFVNNVRWDDQDYIIGLENGPSLFQKLSEKKALSYHAHVFSESQDNLYVTNYLLQITYRQNLYKSWFFVNVTPFLNFPRERKFQRTPGLLVRFDTIFGHI